MESQKKVWGSIAKEWHEFRNRPKEDVISFITKQKGKILDLGSGSGRYLVKNKNLRFYLVDFSDEMIDLAKKRAKELSINAEFFVKELQELPFENNFFDAAIVIDSMQCIENSDKRERAIQELFRVLKSKALAKISVWNKESKRFKNSKKERYVRWRDKGARYYYLYSPEEIYADFENAGFRIIKKYPLNLTISFTIEKP